MFAHIQSRRFKPSTHDEVLRHRLSGAARLGGYDEQRRRQLEAVEQRRDRHRVHVVQHVKARLLSPLLARERVPAWRQQRRAKRDGTESRTADAEDYHVFDLRPLRCRSELDALIEDVRVVRQVEEPELAAFPFPRHCGLRIGEGPRGGRKLEVGDSAFDRPLRHERVVERDHGRSGWG
jgi:hypothetical protein